MSTLKRPFAEAVEDERGAFRLHLDGELQGAVILNWSQAHAITAALNQRVEARKAKLRGALSGLEQRRLNDGPCWCFLWPDEQQDAEETLARDGHCAQCLAARAAIADTGPDYVPGNAACGLAWDLGAAQATISALSDIITAVDGAKTETIAPFLEALGQRPTRHLATMYLRDGMKRATFIDQGGEERRFDYGGTPIKGPIELVVRRVEAPGHGARAHSVAGPVDFPVMARACGSPDCANSAVYGQELCRAHLQIARLSQQNAALLEAATRLQVMAPPAPIVVVAGGAGPLLPAPQATASPPPRPPGHDSTE